MKMKFRRCNRDIARNYSFCEHFRGRPRPSHHLIQRSESRKTSSVDYSIFLHLLPGPRRRAAKRRHGQRELLQRPRGRPGRGPLHDRGAPDAPPRGARRRGRVRPRHADAQGAPGVRRRSAIYDRGVGWIVWSEKYFGPYHTLSSFFSDK